MKGGGESKNHPDKATDPSLFLGGPPPSVQGHGPALFPLRLAHLRHLRLISHSKQRLLPRDHCATNVTLALTTTFDSAGADLHAQHDDWHAWRMPGEDDHGQEEHAALYNHVDSDSESVYGGASPEADGDEVGESEIIVPPAPQFEWDWEIDQADRARERRHDGTDVTFQVDRKVMRDVVKERMGAEVARIRFISSGTLLTSLLIAL